MTREEFETLKAGTLAEYNLNPDGVSRMSEKEILEQFQAVSNKIAMQNNMIPAEVLSQELPANEYGYQEGATIVLNSDLLSPNALSNLENLQEMQDTIYHENSHLRDFEASFLSEVRSGMTSEEIAGLADRLSEVPEDWDGYYYHPGEVKAREMGQLGVETIARDQELFAQIDTELNGGRNQILAVCDFAIVNGEVVYGDTFEISNVLDQESMNISDMQTFEDNDGMILSNEEIAEVSESVDECDFSSLDDGLE